MPELTIEKLQEERKRLVEQRETAVRQVAALDGAVAFCDYCIKQTEAPDAPGPDTDSPGDQAQPPSAA